MMVFNFKGGIRLFSQRLNQVIDRLDPIEVSLVETLLGIAIEPQQPMTMAAIQRKLNLTAAELTLYLNRLVRLNLITWATDEAVPLENA
ncbi:hypothetical protein [Levilactobacillus sp. HBUAS70063]|uniref:hypothetical protein n=1 Tax=Levilactobacillus sp. HBUAS70063 TaxID=3109359 RepID=UPI0031330B60